MINSHIKADRLWAIPALILLIAAFILGSQLEEKSLIKDLERQMPQSDSIIPIKNEVFYLGFEKSNYLIMGTGNGYGGRLLSAIQFDSTGLIQQVFIIQNKETPSFVKRIENRKFLDQYIGHSWASFNDQSTLPDVISGATYTCNAINQGVYEATLKYAQDIAKIETTKVLKDWRFPWTINHSILAVVFILSFLISQPWFRRKILARWILIVFNMIFLGFWASNQLSIVQISRFGMGEIPPIAQHSFFYLLLIGSLSFILLLNKNLYYDRICPFGAAQECLAAIGGAKKQLRDKKNSIRWVPRILALSILILAVLFRHPSSVNYEVFSAFFQLVGNSLQFVLLVLVLISSLFVKRPWCSILCPIKPILDYIRMLRNWALQIASKN